MAEAILYVYLNRYESRWVEVVTSMLWDFPAIFIYTGLILIQYQKDWESEQWSAAHGDVMEKSPDSDISDQKGQMSKQPTVIRVDSSFSTAPWRPNTDVISYSPMANTGAPVPMSNTSYSSPR